MGTSIRLSISLPHRIVAALVPALIACAPAAPVPAAEAAAQKPPKETVGLYVAALAGQQVAILPLTMLVADPAFEDDSAWTPYRERAVALRRADSLVSGAFESRAPEVEWVSPFELRKMARRAPGMLANPDEMGQAMLRGAKIEDVPDPLRSSLRKLAAVAGGRMVLVPAAVGFSRDSSGAVRADLTLVMVDARGGRVVWRSIAHGLGPSSDAALRQAVAVVLPE